MTNYRRDDGSEVELEYSIESHGCPSNGWDEPGEPTIVAITEVWDLAGNDVALTEAERERLEVEIGQQIDEEPVDDYYPDE